MIVKVTKDNFQAKEKDGFLKDIINDFLNNPFSKILVFYEENEIKSYLYYSDIYDRVEINDFKTKEEYQKKGIGTNLLKELIKENKDITLEVKIDNPAIKLYKKLGFKEVAIRKGYYKGIDGILMERKK